MICPRSYAALAEVVVAGTADNLVHFKQIFVGKLYAMLSTKPELERKLLPALINKLGDTDRKVHAKFSMPRNPGCSCSRKGVIVTGGFSSYSLGWATHARAPADEACRSCGGPALPLLAFVICAIAGCGHTLVSSANGYYQH